MMRMIKIFVVKQDKGIFNPNDQMLFIIKIN